MPVDSHILPLPSMLRVSDKTAADFGRLKKKDEPSWHTLHSGGPIILRDGTKGEGPSNSMAPAGTLYVSLNFKTRVAVRKLALWRFIGLMGSAKWAGSACCTIGSESGD